MVLEQDPAAFPADCRVRPHAPFPLGKYIEAMTLVDRVGLTAQPKSSKAFASLGAAERLIAEAVLVQHEGKRLRNEDHTEESLARLRIFI